MATWLRHMAKPQSNLLTLQQGRLLPKLDWLMKLTLKMPSSRRKMHIASVSKQFTAFLALLLEEEGKLILCRG
jgi:hypothetical protein